MRQWKVFSILFAVLAGAVMLFAAPTQAAAQQDSNCCRFFVDVEGVSNSCFPFRLWTLWHPSGVLGPIVVAGNGVTTHPAPPNNCPPAEIFRGASLAGNAGPWATFNNPIVYRVNGCCLVVRIGFTDTGCVIIHIRQVNGPC
jgi:hypothetical protein